MSNKNKSNWNVTTTDYHNSNFIKLKNQIGTVEKRKRQTIKLTITYIEQILIASCGIYYAKQ